MRIAAILISALLGISTLAPVTVPEEFRGTLPNTITGSENLGDVFEKLHRGEQVRLMVLGDSHINGNFLPSQLEEYLDSYFTPLGSDLEMMHYGIDGAWARRFCRKDVLDMVEEFKPNFVILAFGTNEAHNTTVDPAYINRTYHRLVDSVRVHTPSAECTFLLTTPPGSHVRKSNSEEGGYEYRPNLNNGHVAKAISQFGQDNGIAVWDLFNIIGGNSNFSRNWKSNGYMQADNVHYKKNGYELQGGLLATAFIEAYETYVSEKYPPMPEVEVQTEPQPETEGFLDRILGWIKGLWKALLDFWSNV